MTHAQYNEKFIQLKGKSSKPAQDNSAKNAVTPPSESTNITLKTGNWSVLKPIPNLTNSPEPFGTKNASVSAPKQLVKQAERPTKKVAREKDWDSMETEDATVTIHIDLEEGEESFNKEDHEVESLAKEVQEGIEEVIVSEASKMSIDRFRSFISNISGGDGTGYTAMERRLVMDPGSEDDILQGFLDYWGQ